jgi:hypothetical protein
MDNVLSVSEFKTDTLHKYMKPVYAEMNLHLFDPDEEKQKVLQQVFPMFFRRMREYRNVSLEEISTKYKIPLERFEIFESGHQKLNREIECAYLEACGGYAEIANYERQIREFKTPLFKDSRFVHAQMAARVGMVIPGIDYMNLNPDGAAVLPFTRSRGREY